MDDRRPLRITGGLGPWTVVASAFAAGLALLGGVLLIPPSRAEHREAAVALVPSDAEITDLGENTGSELVSGQYFASAAFSADGISSEALDSRAVQHALRAGWDITRVDEHPYSRETWLRRGTLVAQLFIREQRVEGEWHVWEDRAATRGAVLFVVVVAPLVVVAGSVLVAVALRGPTRT